MPILGDSDTSERLQVLAGLLAAPVAESRELLRELASAHPWLQPSVDELETLPLDRWQGEHTRLFLNGYPKTPCPPFASAYRHGAMGSGIQADLVALYRALGLACGDTPPDYLGVMLECAARLEAQGGGCGPRQRLWDEYLSDWLPRFAADLEQYAELELYRALGRQLAGLVEMGAGQ